MNVMTIYTKKRSQPFKWLFALLVFLAVMCFTLSDVYGIQINSTKPGAGDKSGTAEDQSLAGGQEIDKTQENPGEIPAGSTLPVPEPMTLILVAGGLTAMYTARKLRHKVS